MVGGERLIPALVLLLSASVAEGQPGNDPERAEAPVDTEPEEAPDRRLRWFPPAPGPPHPMDLTRRIQLYGGILLRFGGNLRSDWQPFDPDPLDRPAVRGPLAPTPGAFVGADFVPSRYFAVGPRVAFGAWRAEVDVDAVPEAGSARSFDVDVGVSLRPRFPLHIGRVYVEASLAVVAGVTVASVRDLAEQEAAPGYHLAILPGIRVLITRTVGVMAELGFAHHALWHGAGGLDGRERSARNQGVLNVGVMTTF